MYFCMISELCLTSREGVCFQQQQATWLNGRVAKYAIMFPALHAKVADQNKAETAQPTSAIQMP